MRKLVLVVIVAVLGPAVRAQTPACDALAPPQRALAARLLASEHPYECCDDTVARCLAAPRVCALAVRLADNICRRIAAGQNETRIRRALSRRARSMVGNEGAAESGLDPATSLGPHSAPVTVTVYACARCPYCSKLVPALVRAVREGDLKDKVRLGFRTFPIRGHEGATEGGLAFVAAAEMGRFWEFLLFAYSRFDEFSPDRLPIWAAEVGLEREAFVALLGDPATREKLVASKKEGVVNRVEETPTLFLNGRRWVGDLEIAEIVDAVEEELDRVGGRQWHTR